jgi:hypothetical protein
MFEQYPGIDLHAGLERFRTPIRRNVGPVRNDGHPWPARSAASSGQASWLLRLQGRERNLRDRSLILTELLIRKRSVTQQHALASSYESDWAARRLQLHLHLLLRRHDRQHSRPDRDRLPRKPSDGRNFAEADDTISLECFASLLATYWSMSESFAPIPSISFSPCGLSVSKRARATRPLRTQYSVAAKSDGARRQGQRLGSTDG